MKNTILYRSLAVITGLMCILDARAMIKSPQITPIYSFSTEKKATWESLDIEITLHKGHTSDIGRSTVSYRRKEKDLVLQNLYVSPKYRGNGAGSALFKHTMGEIQRLFPQQEHITWKVAPTEIFKTNQEHQETVAKLVKFYSQQKARIEQKEDIYPTGSFFLKNKRN